MIDSRSTALVGGGTVLTAIALVLPWLKPTSAAQQLITESSNDPEALNGIVLTGLQPIFSGPVAAGIAVVLLAVALFAGGNRWADAGIIVGGAIVSLVAAVWILAPQTILGGTQKAAVIASLFTPSIGVFLTVLGGLLILAGGALSYTGYTPGLKTAPA